MKWISVKKRLPEPKTMCIVSTNEGVRQSYFTPMNEFAIYALYGIKVTHWIPMPEMPKTRCNHLSHNGAKNQCQGCQAGWEKFTYKDIEMHRDNNDGCVVCSAHRYKQK